MLRVVSIPPRLRWAAATLMLSVAWAAVETAALTRLPWWKLPWRTIALWATSVFLIVTPLTGWILAGRRWAWFLGCAFGGIWVAITVGLALKMRNPGLGFFALFLSLYLGLVLYWLHEELQRSYFDPLMRWYEGEPQAIPRVECKLEGQAADAPLLRVSRLDREGAFVYGKKTGTLTGLAADLTFKAKGREIKLKGKVRRILDQGRGAGLEFVGLSPDQRKELGDFVELLRGGGYV